MKKKWFKRILFSFGALILLLISVCATWLVCGEGRYCFYLPTASKIAIKLNSTGLAKSYADEMIATANAKRDWNYGNALFDAHITYGRLALIENDITMVKFHLLQAGKTPGSPQLDNFGPGMGLANDLLNLGERDAVLEFIDLCRKFWAPGQEDLSEWERIIKSGEIPDFYLNSNY
jgi:hypothetical protein